MVNIGIIFATQVCSILRYLFFSDHQNMKIFDQSYKKTINNLGIT